MSTRAVTGPPTKGLQIATWVCALIPLALAWSVSFDDSWLGFRDGYISAYDHAMLLPHQLFCAFSVAVSIALIYFAWRRHWNAVLITAALYAFAGFVTFSVVKDHYYDELDHGQGG